jgi:hypothetical protein
MKILFHTIVCCLFTVSGNAQDIYKDYRQLSFKNISSISYNTLMASQFDFKSSMHKPLLDVTPGTKFPPVNHLPGLFCKLEYKIEVKSKLAPRFRLGSLAYTEWMEGKRMYGDMFIPLSDY